MLAVRLLAKWVRRPTLIWLTYSLTVIAHYDDIDAVLRSLLVHVRLGLSLWEMERDKFLVFFCLFFFCLLNFKFPKFISFHHVYLSVWTAYYTDVMLAFFKKKIMMLFFISLQVTKLPLEKFNVFFYD